MIALPKGFRIVKRGGASNDLIARVERQESGGDPFAVSPKGARGPMQLMPATMADPGFGVNPLDPNAADPMAENRRMGKDYLNAMLQRYNGNEEAALVAYNWGPGNADKWIAAGRDRKRLPAETQGYLRNILGDRATETLHGVDIDPTTPRLGAVGAPAPVTLPPGFKKVQKTAPPTPPEPAGDFRLENEMPLSTPARTVADRAKQVGYGVTEGVAGIAGTAGDIDKYARKAAHWLLTQAGATDAAKALEQSGSFVPDTEAVTGAYAGAIGGLEPPQDTTDEYLRTAGQFAPAVVGGKGGLIRRGAQALVPAVASETAGQVARKVAPEYETPARVATAIATSPAGARAGIKKPPTFKPETAAKLRAEAKMAFMEAEQQGIKIDGPKLQAMVADLERRLVTEGLDPDIHPKATSALRRLKGEAAEMAPKPAPAMGALTGAAAPTAKQGLPLTEAQTLRRVLSSAARSPDKDERRLAGMMIEKLDDLVDSHGGEQWAKARGLYHKFSKAQQIEDMLENSGLRSGQFSVSGMENAIRTEFRQLYRKIIKDGRERARWTPQQRALIKRLGNMTGAVNMLRLLGKLSPRSQLMLAGGVGGAGVSYGSGDPTAVGTAGAAYALGTASQLAALGLTKRKVNQLRANVTGSAPPPTVPGFQGTLENPLASALIAAGGTLPLRQ